MELIIILAWWVIGAVVGGLIGKGKGRTGAGAMWGLLFGPIGWLIILLVPDVRPKCPACGGAVVKGATKCMHCASEIPQSAGKK